MALSADSKHKYIKDLFDEQRFWSWFDRTKVEGFIRRAKEIIRLVDGNESKFLVEIDPFSNAKNGGLGVVADWHQQIHNALLDLQLKLELQRDSELGDKPKNAKKPGVRQK